MGKEMQAFDTRYIRRLEHIKKKDRLLSSIYKISQLLNRSITSDKVLQALVNEMKRAFDLQRSLIFLINKKENKLEVKYVIGFSPVEMNRAFNYPLDMNKDVCRETLVAKTGKTIYIRNSKNSPIITEFDFKMDSIWNRTSSISMPLKIKGEIIGVIQGDQTEKELILSKGDIKLFSTFASHASTIIENARLQEQNKKKIAQLLSLQEIIKKTSSTLDLRELLNIVTSNALKITGASVCTLLLAEKDNLRIVSRVGYDQNDAEKFRMKIGEGIAGWVAEKGVPLLIGDVSEEPRYIEIIPGIGSTLAVPLVSEKKALGVLVVDSYTKSAFSLDDLELLLVFAGHTAVVIDSVRLYEQVRAERNFAANILESQPNGIITIDENKKIRALNRKVEEILGIKRKNMLDKKISEVFKDTGIIDLLSSTIDEQRIIENQEVTLSKGDGSTVILGLSSSSLKTDEKGMAAMIITIQDLTVIKRTEALIRRMDRLSSLGQLSAGIAHEIRNPLASINFNAQLLSKRLVADKNTEGILNDTFEGIERIKVLVKRILDFTKTGQPTFRKGPIHNVISDSLSLIEPQIKERKVQIKKFFTDGIPDVIFDPHQIQQVFVNLLMNALESMENGGTIEIMSEVERNRPEGMRVTVTISDDGMGIPKENVSKVFDPFFTTKPDGTGLGLSIVYKIMEQHDGQVEIKSRENQGTSFILRFPIKMNI
ncbi:MAG: GAF domain-containing protein [Syntrophales bacterium]